MLDRMLVWMYDGVTCLIFLCMVWKSMIITIIVHIVYLYRTFIQNLSKRFVWLEQKNLSVILFHLMQGNKT